MWETIKTQWSAKVALFIFVFFTLIWIILQFMNLRPESEYNQLWGATYGIIALWGSIWGMVIAKKWGGFQSVMGKSIFFFSFGLLLQEFGQIAYAYYISFLHQPIPYPSVGDYFFYGTIPVYIVGVIYLAKAAGVHFSLRSFTGKLQAILIPGSLLALSYFLFLQSYEFDWSNPIKVIIDFGAPLGQAVYISLAILTYTLTRGMLGGMMKSKILFIIIALVAQYLADWVFLYQASQGTWYTGGFNDYQYFLSYFLMTLGLIQLNTVYNKLQHIG